MSAHRMSVGCRVGWRMLGKRGSDRGVVGDGRSFRFRMKVGKGRIATLLNNPN